jgi:uncharacterized protein YacL (UPF0231 family)
MKYLPLLLASFLSIRGYSQVFTFCIDSAQNFRHESTISIYDAVRNNNIELLNKTRTDIIYYFDLANGEMIRTMANGEKVKDTIISIGRSGNHIFDVYTISDKDVILYTLMPNEASSGKYTFISGQNSGNKTIGWFDDNVSYSATNESVAFSSLPDLAQRTLLRNLRDDDIATQNTYMVNVDTSNWKGDEIITGDITYFDSKSKMITKINSFLDVVAKKRIDYFINLKDNILYRPRKQHWYMLIGVYRLDWWFSANEPDKLETITIIKTSSSS